MAMIKDIESFRKWINGFLDHLKEKDKEFLMYTGDMTKRTVTNKGDHFKLNSDMTYLNVFKTKGIAPIEQANSASYGTLAVEKKYVKDEYLPENQDNDGEG